MKFKCVLVAPPTRIGGTPQKGKITNISRKKAAKYLMACRQGRGLVVRLTFHNYAILPDGFTHGFRLLTGEKSCLN